MKAGLIAGGVAVAALVFVGLGVVTVRNRRPATKPAPRQAQEAKPKLTDISYLVKTRQVFPGRIDLGVVLRNDGARTIKRFSGEVIFRDQAGELLRRSNFTVPTALEPGKSDTVTIEVLCGLEDAKLVMNLNRVKIEIAAHSAQYAPKRAQ
jgi:hypothetical protein